MAVFFLPLSLEKDFQVSTHSQLQLQLWHQVWVYSWHLWSQILTPNQATEAKAVFRTSASSSAHHKAFTSSISTNKKNSLHQNQPHNTNTGGQFTCTPPLIPLPPYNTLLTTPSQWSTGCCCLHHPLVSAPTAQPHVADAWLGDDLGQLQPERVPLHFKSKSS